MENFWDYSVWSGLNLAAVLLMSLLAANVLKKSIKFLQASLIPASVLGGGILIIVAGIYKECTGDVMFDTLFRRQRHGGTGDHHLSHSGAGVHCLGLQALGHEADEKACH